MGLPFEPEMEESLKQRFKDALSPIYLVEGIEQGGIRPGQLRKHVFDFYDGTRFIVSRESIKGAGKFLHVSVSFQPGFGKPPVGPDLLRYVIERVNDLRGVVPGLVQAFASQDGILHFLFPDAEPGAVIPPNPQWN